MIMQMWFFVIYFRELVCKTNPSTSLGPKALPHTGLSRFFLQRD